MDQLNQEQMLQVKNFISACNSFIKGKFILTDVKLANILKAIAESESVYNLLAEHLINFDFNAELKKCCVKNAVEGGSFKLPKEQDAIIPLVFCLLVEIDSKRIDFDYFLRSQFPYAENQNEQYDRFAQEIIAPFRDAVADKFGTTVVEEEKKPTKVERNIIDIRIEERQEELAQIKEEVEEVEEPKTPLQEFCESIIASAQEMLQDLGYVKKATKRDNVRIVLNALVRACETQELVIINGLIVALNEIVDNDKILRYTLEDIKQIFANFIFKQS